jgi:hypothetical protein
MATPEPPPVVIIAPPPPEPAPDPRVVAEEERERAAREPTLDNGGFELAMGTLFLQPALGNTPFDGSGKPLNTQLTQSFHHRGRELGLDRPLMWGGEVSVHYMRRYFAAGVLAFIAGHPGATDAAIPATARTVPDVNQGALTGWGGGIDLAGARWPERRSLHHDRNAVARRHATLTRSKGAGLIRTPDDVPGGSRMAEPRSRKTSEHDAQLIRLVADAVAMRAQMAALEQRVQRLEAELAASRAGTSGSKRPPAGPPPLPKMPPVPHAPAGAVTSVRGSRKSVVDISEIAELVDSVPPPPLRPRK